MFNVDWSDPNRESVGDRRARKQKEREKDAKKGRDSEDQDKSKDDQQSSRASESVRSSMSSVEKQFGFFGGKSRKKGGSSAKAKSTASSSLRAPTIQEQQQADETPAPSPGARRAREPELEGPDEVPGLPDKRFSSFSDSVFNKLDEDAPGSSLLGCDTAADLRPKPGITTLIQQLGEDESFITKTIEATVRPRTNEDSDVLLSRVTITSDAARSDDDESTDSTAAKSLTSTPWQPPTQMTQTVHPLPTVPESMSLPDVEVARHVLPVISETTAAVNQGVQKPKSKRKPRPMLSAPKITPASQRPTDNPDVWKAPDAWGYSPTEPVVSEVVEEAAVPNGSKDLSALALDLANMQREVKRMLGASPQVVLLRLKGEWGHCEPNGPPELDPADPRDTTTRALDATLIYKELEMEKKRWMLSALHHMETILDPEKQLSKPREKPNVKKALALFESQATASYIACMNRNIPVYHLSPDPLSPKQYPNIHSFVCPTISASAVAVASQSFSSVNCLSIASILPSSDIPKLLQNIHRVLAPGGFLNMVIIDPLPVATSTGPALRQWLDENLILNLEQLFRCTNPSRNFPMWLQYAKLRARGSVITTTRFQAIPQSYGQDGASDDTMSQNSEDHEMAIKKELRTMVGRMLWQEIWGPFVTAEKWWWEIPEIVDECVDLETHWEYNIIAACKESDD